MLMLDKALKGSHRYWMWLLSLLCIMAAGFCFYLRQLDLGLGITGLSRDVSWGSTSRNSRSLSVSPLRQSWWCCLITCTAKSNSRASRFLASLAIASVIMCILFIFVDLGQPARVLNIILYPSPRSLMFWDMISLSGYLLLNAIIASVTLRAEREETQAPGWIKPLAILSIPWAISRRSWAWCGKPAVVRR